MRRGRPETIHAQKNGLPFFLFLIPFLVVPFVAATAATAISSCGSFTITHSNAGITINC